MGTQVSERNGIKKCFKILIDDHFACRFVNFLKTFESDKMEIAFNAERSIQDAITELSESESTTVVISYSVMFIYVAIALGSFRSFYTLLVWNGLNINI